MREWIDESYRFALESARAALGRNTGLDAESKRSLIEAVWWVAAADGYLQEAFGSVWRDHKQRHKPTDLLSGIYWARNRAIHDPLSLATMTEPSDAYTVTYAEGYGTWAWRPVADIAKIDPARDLGDGHIRYAAALAGRPIVNTLNEAIETLDGLNLTALGDHE